MDAVNQQENSPFIRQLIDVICLNFIDIVGMKIVSHIRWRCQRLAFGGFIVKTLQSGSKDRLASQDANMATKLTINRFYLGSKLTRLFNWLAAMKTFAAINIHQGFRQRFLTYTKKVKFKDQYRYVA